jgi:hypothetical protein
LRRLLILVLATTAVVTMLGTHKARAESVCHGGAVIYYSSYPLIGGHNCKYEEHGVYWTCAATDPETGKCWKYDVKQARWRGDTDGCFGSSVSKWRLMYARLIRISDGAVIWSIGWQPYYTNCTHGAAYYFAGINKQITTPHAVTFKFEHVASGAGATFNTWGRINLLPGV